MQGPKQDIYLCKSKYFHFKYCMLGYGGSIVYSNEGTNAKIQQLPTATINIMRVLATSLSLGGNPSERKQPCI